MMNVSEEKARVSYWLIPAEPDAELFGGIICDLAGWFLEAPVFEPHVTLYSGPLDPRDDVEGIIAGATGGVSSIVLRAAGLGRSDEFTKSLFVILEPNETVAMVGAEVRRRSATPVDYDLSPHLSLIYARLSHEMKDRLARDVSIPATISFDAVRAVRTGVRTESKADVDAWRTIVQRPLHSA
jgi:hypothetical protein